MTWVRSLLAVTLVAAAMSSASAQGLRHGAPDPRRSLAGTPVDALPTPWSHGGTCVKMCEADASPCDPDYYKVADRRCNWNQNGIFAKQTIADALRIADAAAIGYTAWMIPASVASRHTSLAILLFLAGIFFFAVNDALGKWLVTAYPVGEIMLIRSCGAGLFLVPMLARNPARLRRPAQLGLHAVRVLIMAGDSFAFYFATRSLPLADVMTFYLAAPLFVTLLAMLALREPIGPWKALAVLVGFLGVVVALHPSSQSLSPAAFVALAGSLMFATAIVITRGLRQTHWLSLVAWQFMGAAVVGAATSLGAWVPPSVLDLGLMLLVGFVSMLCFISINKALSLAQASLLAPFHYTSIIWAVLLGWLIWGDLPTPQMWIGIALIMVSGALVWFRERLASQDSRLEAPIA